LQIELPSLGSLKWSCPSWLFFSIASLSLFCGLLVSVLPFPFKSSQRAPTFSCKRVFPALNSHLFGPSLFCRICTFSASISSIFGRAHKSNSLHLTRRLPTPFPRSCVSFAPLRVLFDLCLSFWLLSRKLLRSRGFFLLALP